MGNVPSTTEQAKADATKPVTPPVAAVVAAKPPVVTPPPPPPAAGTTTATTVKNAGAAATPAKVVTPQATAKLMTPDIYNWFIGIFGFVLSLFVLVSTGSILSVLVLWVTVALVLTVLVYYGILDIDKTIGQEVKELEKPPEPVDLPFGAPMIASEVFHISDLQFTYDEAPAVCAAYGGELATLEQIMDAYAKGAEWCSYGWSAGGMALYPTQRETWDRLQGEVDTGKRTRCGRPGVNGGYFDPSLKFGVNCYGFKPKGDFKPPAPIPGADTKKFRDMVNKFRNMLKSFTVDPYSRLEWSANPLRTVTETFADTGFGLETMFKQDFYTPEGVKEEFAQGDPRYVEPVGAGGIANSARAVGGPYGLVGDRGPIGVTGPIGAAGPIGATGPIGPQGGVGVQGGSGPKGDKGDKGDTGGRGDRGEVGPMGPDPRLPTQSNPCGMLGMRENRQGTMIRVYTKDDCDKMGGRFAGNGECLKPGGGSFTWDCRNIDF